ncbi:MAG: hypothetical protein ACXAB7_18955 [Candidatus Kariarchaeaceae archaeon]
MFRRPKLPDITQKTFDPLIFEKEKSWIQNRIDGKIARSITPGSWWTIIWSVFWIATIVGGSFGAFFGALFSNMNILLYSPLIVFIITLLLTNRSYATVEFDKENRMIFYEGLVNFGGEARSVRYMGPIEVIEGTQVVKHQYFRRTYIRFITKSGYLRVAYRPATDTKFLEVMQKLDLINLKHVQTALKEKTPLRQIHQWKVYYEIEFDREEFKRQMKQKREENAEMEEQEKQRRRKALIEKSKRIKAKETQ